eukprot:2339897-Rhodomonas_salina.1
MTNNQCVFTGMPLSTVLSIIATVQEDDFPKALKKLIKEFLTQNSPFQNAQVNGGFEQDFDIRT